MKRKLSFWLSHPICFALCMTLGIWAWSFSFRVQPDSITSTYQLSSEVDSDSISDFEFELKIKKLDDYNQTHPFDIDQPFVMTAGDNEKANDNDANAEALKNLNEAKPKKFRYSTISDDDLNYLVSYEDPKICGDERNYLENVLSTNAKIAEWTKERSKESAFIPRKCLTFALNSYPEITSKKVAENFKKSKGNTFGLCRKGSKGSPELDKKNNRIKHSVPCISKNIVNVTYNAYADVTACLNLDPKELFPKIYNESGFFMNALGSSMDAGVGQLTMSAILQVNSVYPKYIEQMLKAAAAKPDGACARLMKFKAFLTPVSADSSDRCALMWPVENPLRNIVYMGILSKYNEKVTAGINYVAGNDFISNGDQQFVPTGTAQEELGGNLNEYDIRKKLAQLGLKKVNLHHFKSMMVMVGYNSGIGTALKSLRNYLDERIAANAKTKSIKYNLTFQHFDPIATNVGVLEARAMINSSFIKPTDLSKVKLEKVKRRKALPQAWAQAFTKSYPEYLAYKLNSYDGGKSTKYKIYGVPNYLGVLAAKNKMIRETFQSAGVDPNYCSTETFLKFK